MATFYITELKQIPYKHGSTVPIYPDPEGFVNQTAITTSGTSQQSAAFASETRFVSVHSAGGGVHIVAGDDPTATTAGFFIPADTFVQFEVSPGKKFAVIDAA